MQGDGTEHANGEQPGNGTPQGRQQTGERNDDPLGRPLRSRDFSDGRVKVPGADESASQRAQRILEELRRKLGDATRPREELDYFERLLQAELRPHCAYSSCPGSGPGIHVFVGRLESRGWPGRARP